MECQETQQCEKTVQYDMPYKQWEVTGADIFSIKNNTLLCIVDCFSKFPVLNREDSLLADDLIRASEIAFTEIGISEKIVSDVGTNIISDK